MNELFARLTANVEQRNEVEAKIAELVNAIRGLAKVSEDEPAKQAYLDRLEELVVKPGFVDTVRSILRVHKEGLTPVEIKNWIAITGKMKLSSYSNPLASIHTTLRRMKESGEIDDFEKEGQIAYRLKVLPNRKSPGQLIAEQLAKRVAERKTVLSADTLNALRTTVKK